MAVDYKKQYRPDQLEPFWPNEIIKMSVSVLITLAIIMLLVALPVLLSMVGVPHVMHLEEPANPQGSTPIGIKPEWYFLATYEYLRLMPTRFLGISGKTLGVLSQGPLMLLILTLPFWYRKRASERPRWLYRAIVTAAIFSFLGLTVWGGWPEAHSEEGGEQLVPFAEYVAHHPVMFILLAATPVAFYLLIAQERRAIRRILDAPPPADSDEAETDMGGRGAEPEHSDASEEDRP